MHSRLHPHTHAHRMPLRVLCATLLLLPQFVNGGNGHSHGHSHGHESHAEDHKSESYVPKYLVEHKKMYTLVCVRPSVLTCRRHPLCVTFECVLGVWYVVHSYLHPLTHTCVNVHIYIYCTHIHVCIYIHVHIYIFISVCVCVSTIRTRVCKYKYPTRNSENHCLCIQARARPFPCRYMYI